MKREQGTTRTVTLHAHFLHLAVPQTLKRQQRLAPAHARAVLGEPVIHPSDKATGNVEGWGDEEKVVNVAQEFLAGQ
jgi:hypothetical protein